MPNHIVETDAGAAVGEAAQPLFDRVHGWITTVDHKRLGIMYIAYALFFLVIGGIEATIMRIQLRFGRTTISSRRKSSTGCSPCMAPR